MSRLWSRFGLRTLSIGLLLAVVVGGLYVLQNRQAGSGGNTAAAASKVSANTDQLAERMAARAASTSRQRAAQQQAEQKAKAAAKAAATRARRVNDAATRQKEEESAKAGSSDKATVPYAGPIPSSCNEYKGNRRTGCALLLDAGFGLNQMSCLDKLWTRESGWNPRAHNNSSGAHGIPQAVPGNKMSSVGSDWETNPATQIKWGLGYIKNRYGTPCAAWSKSQSSGWY